MTGLLTTCILEKDVRVSALVTVGVLLMERVLATQAIVVPSVAPIAR